MDGSFVAGTDKVTGGSPLQWTLGNTGAVPWPEMTTMRLVGGPVLMEPVILLPTVQPGQTVVIDLETSETKEEASIAYALVAPEGHIFGEIMTATVVPKTAVPVPKPACAVVKFPEETHDVSQGELKEVQWTLANTGAVEWPTDVVATLFFNTPGLEHLPGQIAIPALAPGLTADVVVALLAPEMAGNFKAMWAVTSPSSPEFAEVLCAELTVDDFPFMDWVFARVEYSAPSSVSAEENQVTDNEGGEMSMKVSGTNHMMQGKAAVDYDAVVGLDCALSVGRVSGLATGEQWIMDLLLTNDGDRAWPENVALSLCYGSGFGCAGVPIEGPVVQPGETVELRLGLTAPAAPAKSAWTLAAGQDIIGKALVLEVD